MVVSGSSVCCPSVQSKTKLRNHFYKSYCFKLKTMLKAIKSHAPRHELITVGDQQGDFLPLCTAEQLVRCNVGIFHLLKI